MMSTEEQSIFKHAKTIVVYFTIPGQSSLACTQETGADSDILLRLLTVTFQNTETEKKRMKRLWRIPFTK
ncbi:unnamed protein product [Leptidea sinapis]|uniref:Uncharacterized protein n=1 Tax=Leptidea sinapis TaxID=189913 RepID=A0A5E4QCQ2_9NEOP|nr:unnamed protein product [Leptidea sinapis]